MGFMAICATAQTKEDALLFSGNEYEGTARTIAMGNAFTALGGDLGSIGINPAGSAVAGYSQMTISPGLSFSATTVQGVSPFSDGRLPYFDKKHRSSMTDLTLPNIGVVLNYNTHRQSGLKNFTFGFVVNKTADWNGEAYANGINSTTSLMGSMAYYATVDGLLGSELGAANAYDYLPWKTVVGYQSGMISTIRDKDNEFVGSSEVMTKDSEGKDKIFLGGPLDQSYGKKESGYKYDYLINLGANISDFIYIGANLGITTFSYGYQDYFKEVAVDPMDFEIKFSNDGVEETSYFNNMLYRYDYNASGVGYYGKFGIIITPGYGLRIGAAFQTPTVNNINEGWQESGETTYLNKKYNASAISPYGEGGYRMVSPYRANLGLAYAFGRLGVISADYEICDYGSMEYKSSGYDREYFDSVNDEIRHSYTAAHMFRAGLEFKPVPELSLRAGYGLETSPLKESRHAIKTQNAAFGLGYSSKGSFFADIAVKGTFPAGEYFMPYQDYVFETDDEGYYLLDENGQYIVAEDGYAPELLIKKNLWKVVLTLGWRF